MVDGTSVNVTSHYHIAVATPLSPQAARIRTNKANRFTFFSPFLKVIEHSVTVPCRAAGAAPGTRTSPSSNVFRTCAVRNVRLRHEAAASGSTGMPGALGRISRNSNDNPGSISVIKSSSSGRPSTDGPE